MPITFDIGDGHRWAEQTFRSREPDVIQEVISHCVESLSCTLELLVFEVKRGEGVIYRVRCRNDLHCQSLRICHLFEAAKLLSELHNVEVSRVDDELGTEVGLLSRGVLVVLVFVFLALFFLLGSLVYRFLDHLDISSVVEIDTELALLGELDQEIEGSIEVLLIPTLDLGQMRKSFS